ncbi:hypothetical protein I309_06476 [Cryptococcus deuterogattii LA55]|nr:hypothetical protein I309_06476 [Cryptococcus deuterogattii LA55]KIR91236.1 hypothetical protein I304_04703 [Cryptococcus deuterogattii CBS 10090]
MSLLPTTSQPSPLTRGREEEGGKQKHNAPESSIPRTVAFFVTKQQRMDARDALRRFGGQSRSSRHFLWFYLPGTSLESPGQIQKGPYPFNHLELCGFDMVDLWQKGGRAARGRRVTGKVIWLAPLDALGPSDIGEKKSEDLHSISLGSILYTKKAFKYRQRLRAKCPYL